MSSYSRQQLEKWLKTISVPAMSRVLDVGGSQKPVKDRLGNKGEASEYVILDLETPHENSQKPDIQMDLNYFNDAPITEPKCDVAFCLEVAEYWWNPVVALENINRYLKHDGTLYISFHFLYPHHKPFEQDYLRYTVVGAQKLLSKAGFKLVSTIPRTTKSMSPALLYNAEGMRGKKDEEIGCLIKAIKV